jgi:acyl-CoA thioesterase-2
MPEVDGPDGLKDLRERRLEIADRLPEALREDFARERDIEIRDVAPLDLIHPEIADDHHNIWFRVSRPIDVPPALHHCLLAYASDMALLSSSYRPHGITWLNHKELMSASLDHAMWLHGPIKFDEWHLYSMDSPFAGKGRGFNRGMIFNMAGDLVASVAQEGLVRRLRTKD